MIKLVVLQIIYKQLLFGDDNNYYRFNDRWIEAAATFSTSNEITTELEEIEKMLKKGTMFFAFGRIDNLTDI